MRTARRRGPRPRPASPVTVVIRRLAAVSLAAVSAVACASPAPGSPAPVSWKKVWSAGFGGPAGGGIDAREWTYDTGVGVFGNHEVETMTTAPGNVSVDGHGDLAITPFYLGTSWKSGRIQTTRVFSVPARGALKVTASIKLPSPARGLGYWPAFWMLGQGPWPEDGEIDILEDVNGLPDHSSALHCGNLTHRNPDGTTGPCHEHAGLGSGLRPCPGCAAGFHTYSVVIDRRDPGAGQIRWYTDGREFFTVDESRVGAAAWNSAVSHGFSLILDVAIGGQFPDQRCGCSTPNSFTTSFASMLVHSVAVYRS